MANIRCTNTGNKIRLKKMSPDRAIANASATIIGDQGTQVGPISHSFTWCHIWDRDTKQGSRKES